MTTSKLTPGEKLYIASQNDNILVGIAMQIVARKEAKKAAKAISDAKFRESMKNYPAPVVAEIVIPVDAAQYSHKIHGTGLLICEDEATITLSFNGQIKKLVKAYTILTKI